jgi:hypothetical protein
LSVVLLYNGLSVVLLYNGLSVVNINIYIIV